MALSSSTHNSRTSSPGTALPSLSFSVSSPSSSCAVSGTTPTLTADGSMVDAFDRYFSLDGDATTADTLSIKGDESLYTYVPDSVSPHWTELPTSFAIPDSSLDGCQYSPPNLHKEASSVNFANTGEQRNRYASSHHNTLDLAHLETSSVDSRGDGHLSPPHLASPFTYSPPAPSAASRAPAFPNSVPSDSVVSGADITAPKLKMPKRSKGQNRVLVPNARSQPQTKDENLTAVSGGIGSGSHRYVPSLPPQMDRGRQFHYPNPAAHYDGVSYVDPADLTSSSHNSSDEAVAQQPITPGFTLGREYYGLEDSDGVSYHTPTPLHAYSGRFPTQGAAQEPDMTKTSHSRSESEPAHYWNSTEDHPPTDMQGLEYDAAPAPPLGRPFEYHPGATFGLQETPVRAADPVRPNASRRTARTSLAASTPSHHCRRSLHHRASSHGVAAARRHNTQRSPSQANKSLHIHPSPHSPPARRATTVQSPREKKDKVNSNAAVRKQRSDSGRTQQPAAPAGPIRFVNFTADDGGQLMAGVAPSGSSKTKARREREAEEQKQLLLNETYHRALAAVVGGGASHVHVLPPPEGGEVMMLY